MKIIIVSTLTLLLFGCQDNSSAIDYEIKIFEPPVQPEDAANNLTTDTTILITDATALLKENEASNENNTDKKKKRKQEPIPYARIMQFPNDAVWNGKPMIQQIEMSPEIIKNFPDTLTQLAIFNYKGYDYFFPKSIADNFEEGISTEHIHYPKKLIFQFQVFENNFEAKPYLIKEVVIRRTDAGELYAE